MIAERSIRRRGGYTMTGDISGVLDLLNGWF